MTGAIASVFFRLTLLAASMLFNATGAAAWAAGGDDRQRPPVLAKSGADAGWPAELIDWRTSPVDLSFLNAPEKPAGKHGFLKVVKDKLVFENGKTVRFWGTNVTANSLFGTTRENVRQQARRLSALGFNLVRLHHHDSAFVNPNIFGDRQVTNTLNLSSAMLEKLDWWIKCLKDEGIYIRLDLHVGRQLKAGDAIEGFEEISAGKPAADMRGYNYVNSGIRQAMKRFNEAFLTHSNSYTGLRYADDPAIVALLISNENDVTHHFGNRLLPGKKAPIHTAVYMAQAEEFATRHALSKDRVWRAWEYGPSKLFLNDLEYGFNTDMIQHLRALGVKVPIVTTSTWGDSPLNSLPALTAGNLIDVHSYGSSGELGKNPVYAPNIMHWLAAGRIAGRPLSVTEWNVSPFPAPDRHTIPLYLAASASLQGWNALTQYAYSKDPINDTGRPSNWQAYNDPGLLAMLPAAALLYRQGHVQEASTVYVFAPPKEQLFGLSISPRNAIALRSAAEKGKLLIALPAARELPWLEKSAIPAGANVIADPSYSVLALDAAESVSDTGELRRNWEHGIYTINTQRTQAAMGWIGGRKIRLADVDISVKTPNATVAIQSMGNDTIGSARAILISLGARSMPKSEHELPFYSEPVEGQMSIRAPKGLRLFKKYWASDVNHEVPMSYRNGRYLIALDRSLAAHWLVLR